MGTKERGLRRAIKWIFAAERWVGSSNRQRELRSAQTEQRSHQWIGTMEIILPRFLTLQKELLNSIERAEGWI